jgi:hypothetical protein
MGQFVKLDLYHAIREGGDLPAETSLPPGAGHAAGHPARGGLDQVAFARRHRRPDGAKPGFPARRRERRALEVAQRACHLRVFLGPADRAGARGLSWLFGLFRGFDHGAAQQVVGATLHELRDLVNRSMLECGPDGRYAMHELLRQYGRERLSRVPAEEQAIRDRHCAYYARYLENRA